MTGRIYGYTLKTLMNPEAYPELKERLEEGAKELFQRDLAQDPDTLQWVYAPATAHTDPDTGQEWEIPEMWCLIAEAKIE